MNGEYDNGQFELTLCFADALKACDDAFLFRTMARDVAAEMGLLLTFLPKPIPDRGGSGMHVNFSFADQSGANVIAPDGQLSATAKAAMAGLIKHHEGLAALLATTVNSYDRLGPRRWRGIGRIGRTIIGWSPHGPPLRRPNQHGWSIEWPIARPTPI